MRNTCKQQWRDPACNYLKTCLQLISDLYATFNTPAFSLTRMILLAQSAMPYWSLLSKQQNFLQSLCTHFRVTMNLLNRNPHSCFSRKRKKEIEVSESFRSLHTTFSLLFRLSVSENESNNLNRNPLNFSRQVGMNRKWSRSFSKLSLKYFRKQFRKWMSSHCFEVSDCCGNPPRRSRGDWSIKRGDVSSCNGV